MSEDWRGGFEGLDPEQFDDGLPPDSPVEPLGYKPGAGGRGVFVFLSASGMAYELEARHFTTAGLLDLFGGDFRFLTSHFPAERNSKEAFDRNTLTGVLMRAAMARGVFDPGRQVRGCGVWPIGELGERWPSIVIHAGDALGQAQWLDGKVRIDWQRSGIRLGAFAYTQDPPEARPAAEAMTRDEARELVRVLGLWNWRDPQVAPLLALGLIAAGRVPALLPRRPAGWLIAETSVGKTELLGLAHDLAGGRGPAQRVRNATADGIRRVVVGNAARLVLLDDVNQTEDPKNQLGLVELARNAYEPGQSRYARGGINTGEGQCEAAFLFASTNPPDWRVEDRNRYVVLELKALELGEGAEKIKRVREFADRKRPFHGMGDRLFRRILEQLGRFEKTFDAYRAALMAAGHSPRWADTYAVPLTMADLVLHDTAPGAEGRAEAVAELVTVAGVEETVEKTAEHFAAVARLLTYRFRVGVTLDPEPIGSHLERVVEHPARNSEYDKAMRSIGLQIVATKDGERFVAVANANAELELVFKGSAWAKGWSTVLSQYPGARRSEGPLYFARGTGQQRAILLPLTILGTHYAGTARPVEGAGQVDDDDGEDIPF